MTTDPLSAELLDILGRHPDGIGLSVVESALSRPAERRAVQYRLRELVRAGRVRKEGERRWTRYFPVEGAGNDGPGTGARPAIVSGRDGSPPDFHPSHAAESVLRHLAQPSSRRAPAFHSTAFRQGYEPNVTHWLSAAELARLHELGDAVERPQPAGTYARRILDRLLIDLSWNSSRLEGNTYSKLDTQRLLTLGIEPDDGDPTEAQMIRNHREAIEFLVENAGDIGFDRRTVLNLHALLANELLPDPLSPGRLRSMAVGIHGSSYHPPETPQLIEAEFDALLAMLGDIDDPFEQSLVALAQLPYLQPFDDVNKRVSRLAANIPLIHGNLVPISFVDVPTDLYVKALLGVYELQEPALLKDLYLWAYERSARQYVEVRQSLGSPDPFRLRHREALVTLVGLVVRERTPIERVARRVRRWAEEHVAEADRERFREMVEMELLHLNEGNFSRFRLRPSEFDAWRASRDDAGG